MTASIDPDYIAYTAAALSDATGFEVRILPLPWRGPGLKFRIYMTFNADLTDLVEYKFNVAVSDMRAIHAEVMRNYARIGDAAASAGETEFAFS